MEKTRVPKALKSTLFEDGPVYLQLLRRMTVHFKLDPATPSANSHGVVMSLHNLTGSLLSLTLDSFLSYSYFDMTINEYK